MVNRALQRVREAMNVDRCALFVLLPAEGAARLPNQTVVGYAGRPACSQRIRSTSQSV